MFMLNRNIFNGVPAYIGIRYKHLLQEKGLFMSEYRE